MNDLRPQIRAQIARYLADEVDLPSLYAWLGSETWEVERWAPESADLARTAQLLLDEFSHGDWSDDELRSHLRGLVGVLGEYDRTEVTSGSASTTVTQAVTVSIATGEWISAGRRAEMEPA